MPGLTAQSVAIAQSGGLRAGLIVAALAFGFRHGIDWDHLAAISDIAGSQTRARRSVVLATLYALGHALVVVLLGVLAIGFSQRAGIDGVERSWA
jgi:high-affinity nickel permease